MTINTTSHEKDQFTIMLTCTTGSGKLPLYVMLKRKPLPKDKFPADVIVHAQQKGWMDEGWSRTGCARSGVVGQMAVSPNDGAC